MSATIQQLFQRLKKIEKSQNVKPAGIVCFEVEGGVLCQGIIYPSLESIPGNGAGGVCFCDYQGVVQ